MRKLLLAALAAAVMLAPIPSRAFDPNNIIVGHGDSITLGEPSNLSYLKALSLLRNGQTVVNFGVGGAMTGDLPWYTLFQQPPGPGKVFLHMTGTNDWNSHGDTPEDMVVFDQALGAQITYLAGRPRYIADQPGIPSTGWILAGSWQTNISIYGGYASKRTSVHGDIADTTFIGKYVDIVYTVIDGSAAGFYIYVDNVLLGVQPNGPPRPISTPHGHTSTLFMVHLDGYAPGPHTLRLVSNIAVPGNVVILDWISYESNGVPLYVLSSPHADPAKFPDHAKVFTYNAHKQAIVQSFQARGYTNIHWSDLTGDLDTGKDLQDDGSHPTALANMKMGLKLNPVLP
jgi:hypothetical protein